MKLISLKNLVGKTGTVLHGDVSDKCYTALMVNRQTIMEQRLPTHMEVILPTGEKELVRGDSTESTMNARFNLSVKLSDFVKTHGHVFIPNCGQTLASPYNAEKFIIEGDFHYVSSNVSGFEIGHRGARVTVKCSKGKDVVYDLKMGQLVHTEYRGLHFKLLSEKKKKVKMELVGSVPFIRQSRHMTAPEDCIVTIYEKDFIQVAGGFLSTRKTSVKIKGRSGKNEVKLKAGWFISKNELYRDMKNGKIKFDILSGNILFGRKYYKLESEVVSAIWPSLHSLQAEARIRREGRDMEVAAVNFK